MNSDRAIEEALQDREDQHQAEMEEMQSQREAMYAHIKDEYGQQAADIARLYDDAHDDSISDILTDNDIQDQQNQEYENDRESASAEEGFNPYQTESGEPVRAVGREAPGQPQEAERALVMRPSRALPPLLYWPGTSPIHAAT
ncbi:hypothetical protein [Polaromonas sp.]|uniref:hypothetical protein n=1 Tax=Polaromonas sp. TaxID=1869339 RepID=UPI0035679088